MSQPRKPRSVPAAPEGRQKLKQAKAAGRDDDGKSLSYEGIANKANISQKTVQRFFAGGAVDWDYAIAIVQALGLTIEEVVDTNEKDSPDPQLDIDWHQVCHDMLDAQQEIQAFRRQVTGRGLGHEVNIYVPLGLVKPQCSPRRDEKFSPSAEQGMQQYQLNPQEIEKRYEYEEFIQQVIDGEGKNIAIIGEPGAGKTTWLEQIAFHLVGVKDASPPYPICIPLGNLQGKTLEEYLLQIWLSDALRFISPDAVEVMPELEKQLKQLFNTGKVWLLLDGVDEMTDFSPLSKGGWGGSSPLQQIANQLSGWVARARVVLTCRLNVWEANPNSLPNFQTYRTLNFDDKQVAEFIGQWFARAGKPDLGEQLQSKVAESGRERIRDLIRNPLRCSLLCKTWAVRQGELPKTKAMLYQRFRDDFYHWKQYPLLTENLDLQEELHGALSMLALAALEKRLPLREGFVRQVMGQTLFNLSREMGWLNFVYQDAETDEPVYAFFHLTFLEYFAACGVEDWRVFLNHVPGNPNSGTYRIFEKQWKEVILLWLGREDVEREQKEQFIRALVEFEDGCRDFYGYRAYFLAAAGISEFKDCPWADEIVEQIVKWGFGYFNIEKQEWRTFLDPIAAGARETLPQTERTKAIAGLIRILDTTDDVYTRWQAAESLGKIDPGNESAITALLRLLDTTDNESTRRQAVESLWKIDPSNEGAITGLIRILETTDNESTRWQAGENLEEIGMGNEGAIAGLIGV